MARYINTPIRNLSEFGIIRDVGSYNLKNNAFTGGANVRFADGAVRDAPVWRRAYELTDVNPMFAMSARGTLAYDEIFYTTETGRIYRFLDSSNTDVTATGFTPIASELPSTGTQLGGVVYINRETHVPQCRLPTETQFKPLPNWDPNHRAVSLRAFGDFLIALNISRNNEKFTNLVKWSNLTLQGQVPSTWDTTTTENNVAGENPLTDATAPILDGGPLRDDFLIYTARETYLMRYVQSQLVFDFQKISGTGGMINTNCYVEVDGKHYVFGPNSIYVTDGTSQQSISDSRVTNEIYNGMNKNLSERFFAVHNAKLTEIMFCFVSGSDVHFANPTRCNRVAVYNYSNGTWTFYDLPNISFITVANLDSRRTFDQLTGTFDQLGGTFYDMEHSSLNHMVGFAASYANAATGRSIPTSRILGFDYLDDGNLNYPLDGDCFAPAYVERLNMDMDELQLPLNTQKCVRELLPQVETIRDVFFVVQVGAGLVPNSRSYEPPVTFLPSRDNKVNSRATGRYLNVRFSTVEPAGFKFSGYDLKIVPKAAR